MLIRLRRSLLESAAARNLAVDLVKEHGACALDVIHRALSTADAETPCCGTSSENERILTAARTHVRDLIALLPERQRHPARDTACEDPIDRLSKSSR